MEASPLSSSPLLIQSSSKGTEEDLVLEEVLVSEVVLGINRINFLDIFQEQILPLFSGGKLWHAICLGLSFSKNNGNLPILGRCYSPPSAIH